MCKVSWGLGLELARCYFYCFLLTKVSHGSIQIRGLDSTSWWEKLQHHIAKECECREGNKCGHFCNLPQEGANISFFFFCIKCPRLIITTPSHGFHYPHITEEEVYALVFAISNSYGVQTHNNKEEEWAGWEPWQWEFMPHLKGAASAQFSFWLPCENVVPLLPALPIFKRETGNLDFYVKSPS